MSDVLKGNFEPKKNVKAHVKEEEAEEKFEREARKRLGGSIAFVSKQKVNWSEYDDQKKDK